MLFQSLFHTSSKWKYLTYDIGKANQQPTSNYLNQWRLVSQRSTAKQKNTIMSVMHFPTKSSPLSFNVISKLNNDNRENLLRCIHAFSHDSLYGPFRLWGSVFLCPDWCQLLGLSVVIFIRLLTAVYLWINVITRFINCFFTWKISSIGPWRALVML